VRDLFLIEQVNARIYPVGLRFRQQGKTREVQRFLLVFDPLHGLIDLERSGYAFSPTGTRYLARVILTDAAKERQLPLFLGTPLTQLLLHDRLRAQMETAQIDGCAFAPLDTVHNPWAGLEIEQWRHHLAKAPADVGAWVSLIEDLLLVLQPEEALLAIEEAERVGLLQAELVTLRKQAQAALAWQTTAATSAPEMWHSGS
jgi:hypothetical protein